MLHRLGAFLISKYVKIASLVELHPIMLIMIMMTMIILKNHDDEENDDDDDDNTLKP